MLYTRREFTRASLAAIPAVVTGAVLSTMWSRDRLRPVEGVNLGVITYSFRAMSDQSAEAMLKYVVQTGITRVQLLDDMVERFAGIPEPPASRFTGSAPRPTNQPTDPATLTASWRGVPCAPVGTREVRSAPSGARPVPAPLPPERQALLDAQRKWRRSVPIDRIKALRKLYNDAGVSIFSMFLLGGGANIVASEEDTVYAFDMAEALGATHLTIELPTDRAALKRIGDYALRRSPLQCTHFESANARSGDTIAEQRPAAIGRDGPQRAIRKAWAFREMKPAGSVRPVPEKAYSPGGSGWRDV